MIYCVLICRTFWLTDHFSGLGIAIGPIFVFVCVHWQKLLN